MLICLNGIMWKMGVFSVKVCEKRSFVSLKFYAICLCVSMKFCEACLRVSVKFRATFSFISMDNEMFCNQERCSNYLATSALLKMPNWSPILIMNALLQEQGFELVKIPVFKGYLVL